MATATTVGQVKYDVRLSLDQLKGDVKKAEKIVNDSYKKMSKAGTTSRSSQAGAKTLTQQITKDVEAQVNATKRAAQESFNSISQYTPQIQRQFLTVERANNQVYNATTRSAAAIQKFGSDSVQAQRATNSLNVAVQNQAIAQNKLDSSLNNTGSRLELSRAGTVALTAAIVALGAAIFKNLSAGIARLDTLNNFPRTMQNFGLSAEDGEVAIKALSQELIGLPTSLDEAARSVQRFTAVNKDVKASTALFLGFNNAVIAGGAGMDIQATALEQLTQGYARGRLEQKELNALMIAMPAQMNQVAQAMKLTGDELGEGLKSGDTSIDDFLLTIAKLNTEGVGEFVSFKEQAMNQVGGVQVTLKNLNTAIARSIEGMLSAIGTDEIRTIIGTAATLFENFGKGISGAVQLVKAVGPAGVATGIGIGTLTVAMIATQNATTLAGRAMIIFRGILTAVSKHPIIFAITGIIAALTTVGAVMGVFGKNTEESSDYASEVVDSLENYEKPIRGASDAAADLAKQMAKIDQQIKKTNEDYRYQLAQLVADKNKNIASLQSTLASEEKAYDNAYAERLASFDKSQNEEELSHKDKTKKLQSQIDFLSRYNTQANQKQVSELQFALAQENAEYQKSTALRQNEFDKQTQSELTEYEKRRQENQKKLNEELALLNKHRQDVLSVRGMILRDEIESLKYGRQKQLESLEQQRKDLVSKAGTAGTDAGNSYMNNYRKALKAQASKATAAAEAAKQSKDIALAKTWDSLNFIEKIVASASRAIGLGPFAGWATGGYTGAGPSNQIAGVVHRGEYVLPKEEVNQSTGKPKASQGNTTINVTIQGATGVADQRAFARIIGDRFNEILASQGRKAII